MHIVKLKSFCEEYFTVIPNNVTTFDGLRFCSLISHFSIGKNLLIDKHKD